MSAAARCRSLSRDPLKLIADWMAGAGPPMAPEWPGGPDWGSGEVVLTQSARDAVKLAASAWNFRAGDEVLVPSYNCGSEITPFVDLGARVSMFRVTAQAKIDVDDLVARIGPKTRIVYVTHYFGMPVEAGRLVAACHERNVKVIEDCALSLFSSGTGNLGDAAVFSLRKSLPVPDGGILLLRGSPAVQDRCKAPSWAPATRGSASLVKSWLTGFLPVRAAQRQDRPQASSLHPGSGLPDLPPAYYETTGARARRGSRFAKGILQRIDPIEIRERRQANYGILHEALSRMPGPTPFWSDPLPAGTCPLGFPLLVDDKRHWWRALNAAGVPVSPWWEGCHRGLDWLSFPEALMLKARLLLLPVHQELTSSDMHRVLDRVRNIVLRAAVR